MHSAKTAHTVPSKKYRKITLEMILSSTSLTRSSKESHEVYLARVTHLHLQSKRIKFIEGLELCTNLKVRLQCNIVLRSAKTYVYLGSLSL